MLKRDPKNVRTLQVAVNEWLDEVCTLSYHCDCKLQNGRQATNDPPEMYFTEHKEFFEVIVAPEVLHIRVKTEIMFGIMALRCLPRSSFMDANMC